MRRPHGDRALCNPGIIDASFQISRFQHIIDIHHPAPGVTCGHDHQNAGLYERRPL